jgi:hypothetical protein
MNAEPARPVTRRRPGAATTQPAKEGMMTDSTRVLRRPRPSRTVAPIIATAALALLVAACGSSPSSTGSGAGTPASSPSTSTEKALAFSQCVRARGVPNWPDPGSNGQIPKETAQQMGVSNATLQTALNACQHLLPNTGNIDDNLAALNQWWSQMLRFTQCMRSRGVSDWPGPSQYPPDPVRPTFNLHAAGIGFHQGAQPGNIVNSPQIQAKVQQCESVVHENVSGWFI